MQKFVPRSRVRIIRNERTLSTPFVPKLIFWCISYHLGAFGTIWLSYETQWKTGRTIAKVRAAKSRRNFSQRTHPIQPIGPQTDILVHFVLFGFIWDHLVALQNSMKTGRTSAIVRATKSRQNFSQRTHSIHPIGPQTNILVCFILFGCIWHRLGAL